MTRDEAFLIFDKLRAEGSIVFCMGRLWGWTIALRGKVVSARTDEVIIVSADRQCGSLSLRLDLDDLRIRYAEPREIPMLQGAGERDSTLASLMISLPLRIRPADLRGHLLEAPPRELLFVLELPGEQK
jgi:hypothetical protein